jgi:hypothetical protein
MMAKHRILGPKLFTLLEAEQTLPRVRDLLVRLQSLNAQLERCQKELSILKLVSASGGNKGNPDLGRLEEKEREEAGLLRRMRLVQEEIAATGCVPKSYRDGLVDFFALKDGRLVFLCWKQDEERIVSWHTLEGGFGGRLPIQLFLEPGTTRDDAAS